MADTKLKPLSAGKRAKLEKKRTKLEKKLREVEVQLSAPPKAEKTGKVKKARKGGTSREAKATKPGRTQKAAAAVSPRE